MPFRSVAEVADAVQQGRHHIQHFIRTSIYGSFGTNAFGDASIGTGLPSYNAYLGPALEAAGRERSAPLPILRWCSSVSVRRAPPQPRTSASARTLLVLEICC